tara:strand:+ start:341 stop:538 length:198 start_codon:yes stop_codon:yes gene_type:complete
VAGYGAVVALLAELGRELSIAKGKYSRIFSHLQAQRMMSEELRPDEIASSMAHEQTRQQSTGQKY